MLALVDSRRRGIPGSRLRRVITLAATASVLEACGSTVEPTPNVVLSTAPDTVAYRVVATVGLSGDTIFTELRFQLDISIRNAGAAGVFVNTCQYQIERVDEAGQWQPAMYPLCAAPPLGTMLDAGASHDLTLMVSAGLSGGLGPPWLPPIPEGTYRIRFQVSLGGEGGTAWASSNRFVLLESDEAGATH